MIGGLIENFQMVGCGGRMPSPLPRPKDRNHDERRTCDEIFAAEAHAAIWAKRRIDTQQLTNYSGSDWNRHARETCTQARCTATPENGGAHNEEHRECKKAEEFAPPGEGAMCPLMIVTAVQGPCGRIADGAKRSTRIARPADVARNQHLRTDVASKTGMPITIMINLTRTST